jgi:hypothetical protein
MNDDKDRSPVAILLEDIKHGLNITTEALSQLRQEAIDKLKITIALDYEHSSIKTPIADLENNAITFNESHLSYLWCCCYAIAGLSGIAYEKASLKESEVTFSDDSRYSRIIKTLDWGRTLKTSYNVWPSYAADPTLKDEYVVQANALLICTVIYLFFHELGHLVLHSNMAPIMKAVRKPFYVKTSDDKKRIYNAEMQADDYAFDCIKTSSINEDEKFIKYLGAIIAHLSNFYLLDVPDTRGFGHPDLDKRLRAVIKKIDLKEEVHQIHMMSSCSIGLQLFMAVTYTPFMPDNVDDRNFKDFNELQAHLFGIIDNIKAEAREYHANV